jgi:aryl-alcohol dehydrogenase-like predicted oxidoreductase
MSSVFDRAVSRRAVLLGGVAAGVAAATRGTAASAAEAQLPLIARAIPSSGEKIPVVGIGTNAFDVTAAEDVAARREVLQNLPLLGGSIVDTARVYGRSEEVIGQLVAELGIRDKLFFSTKTPMNGDISNPKIAVDEAFRKLRTDRIDLYEIHNFYGLNELLPVLKEYRQAKKIRYIGVTTSFEPQHALLIDAMKQHQLDFIQVNYSITDRVSAKDVLPMARDKGVAVLNNMPLGGRRGSFMPALANKPLPPWASEVDATSWAQLLLKYNLSQPGITAVIPGTTILAHLIDNQRAARGRLPDAAFRKRIEDYWATLAL